MKTEIKIKIVDWLMGKTDYMLVTHERKEEGDYGAVSLKTSSLEHIGAILGVISTEKKDVRKIIWEAAKFYFSKYEVDRNQFIREITDEKN